MKSYSVVVETQILRFYSSLNERDRRRYAVLESTKLGHGDIQYLSQLLGLHRKTIAYGMSELNPAEQLTTVRIRKKGEDKKYNGGIPSFS